MVKLSTLLSINICVCIFFLVDKSQGTELAQNELHYGMNTQDRNLVHAFVEETSSARNKRSPQFQQRLLVLGLSRPFCSLFGSNGCYPTNVQTLCAAGYRYDYVTRRCRQIQNAK